MRKLARHWAVGSLKVTSTESPYCEAMALTMVGRVRSVITVTLLDAVVTLKRFVTTSV